MKTASRAQTAAPNRLQRNWAGYRKPAPPVFPTRSPAEAHLCIRPGADSCPRSLHVAAVDEEVLVWFGSVPGRLRSRALLPLEPIFAGLHWR